MLFLAGMTLSGCGKGYSPKSGAARSALETALTAWQEGKAIGRIDGTTPPIEVEDGDWFNGKKLASFEILGEEPKEYGVPCFSVRLNFASPPASKEVRYIVHRGGDLLWVRQENDYKRSMNWEAYATEPRKKK
jgi:hypothetical protein